MKKQRHNPKPFGTVEILCACGIVVCMTLFFLFLGQDAGMRTKQRRVREQISAGEQSGTDGEGVITVIKETETQPEADTETSGSENQQNTVNSTSTNQNPGDSAQETETQSETETETEAQAETQTEAETQPQTETETVPETETQAPESELPAQQITETESEIPTETETETEFYPQIEELQEINPDILGILEFGDEQATYVTQGEDNDFYLSHDYTGAYSVEGAAMLDARETVEPRSQNWIIHGHNMRNGAIFGTLKEYRNLDFLKEHPVITFTRLHKKETYLIYAILDINTEENADGYFGMIVFDFETEEDFKDYTGYLCDNSYYNLPVDVTETDELLMLSTCSYGYSDGRLLIACRKVRDTEEEEQDYKELYSEAEYSGNRMVY